MNTPRNDTALLTPETLSLIARRIVALIALKGGVGKSSETANLADALARFGLNVLVVDGDPQGDLSKAMNNAVNFVPTGETRLGGAPVMTTDGYTIDDLVANDVPGHAISASVPGGWTYNPDTPFDRGGPLFPGKVGSISVIRSFDGLAETAKTWSAADLKRLRRSLVEETSDGDPAPVTMFDVVLIDSPPGGGPTSIQAVGAADAVVLIVNAGAFSVASVEPTKNFLSSLGDASHPAPEVIGVAVNRWIGTRKNYQVQAESLVDVLDSLYPESDGAAGILWEPVPESEGVGKAQTAREPLSAQLATYDGRRTATEAIAAINEHAIDLLARIAHPRYEEIAAAFEATKKKTEE